MGSMIISPDPVDTPPVGFIGLGIMGLPMARNLLRRTPLIVWNRSPAAARELEGNGAVIATSVREVVERARVIVVMLRDEAAIDEVLPAAGALPWSGRTLVLMSTVSPSYSAALSARLRSAGARVVEAPVSGSRQPAVEGALEGMASGDDADIDQVEPLLRAMCASVVRCGPIPPATLTKLAVNTVLITLVTGLAESLHLAERSGVARATVQRVIDAGPLASPVSRANVGKLVAEDWSAHAAIHDVLKNARLIAEQATRAGSPSRLIDACLTLYADAVRLGHGEDDMAAVITAYRARDCDAMPGPRE